MVRDRLPCGINHDNVRQRVLAKDKLDLETCIKECRRTSITSQEVRQTKTATAMNGISTGMAASDNVFAVTTCHCDYSGTAHQRGLRFCPAYGRQCTWCGRKNHFSTVCKSSRYRKIGVHEPPSRSRNSRSRVHQLITDDVDSGCFQESEMEILTIRHIDPEDEAEEEVPKVISTPSSRQIFSTMTVSGNRLVQLQIDTGATCNLILKRDLPAPENTAVDRGGKKTLNFYNGTKSSKLRTCQPQLNTQNGNRYWQTFQVVANGATSLIGSPAAQEMNLILVNDECRKELSCNNEINLCSEPSISGQPMTRSEFVKRFPKVLEREIGCLPGKLHLDVVDGARPTHMPTRKFPTAIKERLRAELDRLTRLGIIEQVDEPTEWTSALVIVHKPNGSLRICLDPQDQNPAL